MKNKFSLILLLVVSLFIFGFSYSASAATCERIDVTGDYYYQCYGVRTTQTASGFLGDTITNFTYATSTASWDFYDGLGQTTVHYSRQILASYNFGGTFMNYPNYNLNPLTNDYSCPSGFNTSHFITAGRRNDYNNYLCWSNSTISPVAYFGGMYNISYWDSSLTIFANPFTGDASCPPGYNAAFGIGQENPFVMLLSQNLFHPQRVYYCYADINSNVLPVANFGGTYLPASQNQDVKNPITNDYSCPAGFTDTIIMYTSTSPLHLCYQANGFVFTPSISCTDGIQNGTETDIDCGGSCPNVCVVTPTCTDGIQNGIEAGIDCGGSCPDACTTNTTSTSTNITSTTTTNTATNTGPCTITSPTGSNTTLNHTTNWSVSSSCITPCKYVWFGSNLPEGGVSFLGTNTLSKIYTTIGIKEIFVDVLNADGSHYCNSYPATATTTVIQGNSITNEQ